MHQRTTSWRRALNDWRRVKCLPTMQCLTGLFWWKGKQNIPKAVASCGKLPQTSRNAYHFTIEKIIVNYFCQRFRWHLCKRNCVCFDLNFNSRYSIEKINATEMDANVCKPSNGSDKHRRTSYSWRRTDTSDGMLPLLDNVSRERTVRRAFSVLKGTRTVEIRWFAYSTLN